MRQAMEEILKFAKCKCIDRESLESIAQIVQAAITADDKERNTIRFKHINNDVNGNPRYIVHFLQCKPFEGASYEQTVKACNKIGGRRYHNKSYGGGIVFQGDKREIEKAINELKERTK